MSFYRILAFLIVIISFADCLPPGNITHTPRRVIRFPPNSSTPVRMAWPSVPQVVMPNVPQVVRSKFPQAVFRSKFSQAVKPEAPQVKKLDVQQKLPEVARTPGHRVQLLQSAQHDQLVSASSSSSSRTPSGGWARDKNTSSRIGAAEEQFVFPDDDDDKTPPTHPVIAQKFKPTLKNQPPPCADGTTFCERVDGYPANLENIFDNDLDQFKELQGTDELKSPPITQRIDINSTNEQPLCASVEEVVFPRTAKNKDDKWLFVINTSSFVQGVRIEKCLKTSDEPEQSCFFNDSFPNGYKTVCKQKYIYRRMVAVDDDGKPVKDTFLLPSCCSCTVVSVGAMFRQGMARKPLRTTTTPPPKH
ncbi:uncharacterized protein spz isoform X2 [Halyomorpha halys]|uniref:uncharacterized protein spz isoform X2 n=1 Tax=Halyomorpha halys TaxID=286706 RepID=UPI0034D3000F